MDSTPPAMRVVFGRRVRRRLLGLTQGGVAPQLGMSREHYAMNKQPKLSLPSLFTILTLLISFSYVRAGDVCAPKGLAGEAAAQSLCPAACKTVDLTWNGQWLGETSQQCAAPNTYGSVCGCYDATYHGNIESIKTEWKGTILAKTW